jgi:hypothetical protein
MFLYDSRLLQGAWPSRKGRTCFERYLRPQWCLSGACGCVWISYINRVIFMDLMGFHGEENGDEPIFRGILVSDKPMYLFCI